MPWAMRRRFRGKRKFSRSRRARYEVGQFSHLATIELGQGESTRETPFAFAFYLLGQWGLTTTSAIGSGALRQVVLDQSVRGVQVAEVYLDVDLASSTEVGGTVQEQSVNEFADCLFVDDIAPLVTPNTPVTQGSILPVHIPNLYSNTVGDNVLSGSLATEAGAFQELLGDWPDRVLMRRWDSFCHNVIPNTSSFTLATPIEKLKYQSPINYAPRRIKRRVTLNEKQGLFWGFNMVSHAPADLPLSLMVNGVVVYRVLR